MTMLPHMLTLLALSCRLKGWVLIEYSRPTLKRHRLSSLGQICAEYMDRVLITFLSFRY